MVYHSDEDGNRIADFSYVGYKNGEADLPNIPAVKTLTPINGDNRPQLQAALNEVAGYTPDGNGYRGAVLLGPGTYQVDGNLYISTGGVVLRGSGNGSNPATDTILTPYITDTEKVYAIRIGSGIRRGWTSKGPNNGEQQNIMSEYLPAGSRTFVVEDGSKYSVGNNIIIKHPSTDLWLSKINYGNCYPEDPWGVGSRDMTLNRYITHIEGNAIQIDAPIYSAFDRSLSQAYIYIYTGSTVISESGIENLRVDVERALSGRPHDDAIYFRGVEDCWAKDVTVMNFSKAGFLLEGAARFAILDCESLDSDYVIEGGWRYN